LGREETIVDLRFTIADLKSSIRLRSNLLPQRAFFCCGVVNLRKGSYGVNSISLVQSQENWDVDLGEGCGLKKIFNSRLARRTGTYVCGRERTGEKSLFRARDVISTGGAQNLQKVLITGYRVPSQELEAQRTLRDRKRKLLTAEVAEKSRRGR
jgi:hypothetical protein